MKHRRFITNTLKGTEVLRETLMFNTKNSGWQLYNQSWMIENEIHSTATEEDQYFILTQLLHVTDKIK